MNLPVSDTPDPAQGLHTNSIATPEVQDQPGNDAGDERVTALESTLFERLHGVVSGVSTSHTRHTITLHLDATTEELLKDLGDNLQEVSDHLARFSAEAFDQGVYLVQLKLATSRGGTQAIIINVDGSVLALGLDAQQDAMEFPTVDSLKRALHDALYIDPSTGWAWDWFPCGESSCWKENGHSGICRPSGYDPHAHKGEQA